MKNCVVGCHTVMSSRLISRHILLQGTPLAGPMYCSLRGRSDFWESATATSCSFLGFMDTEEHSWDHLFNILTISQTSLFQKEFLFPALSHIPASLRLKADWKLLPNLLLFRTPLLTKEVYLVNKVYGKPDGRLNGSCSNSLSHAFEAGGKYTSMTTLNFSSPGNGDWLIMRSQRT